MSLNIDNLTPFKENDERREERSKGGKLSGLTRLEKAKEAQAQRFYNLTPGDLNGSAEEKQETLKEYMHARKIEGKRYKRISDRVSQRRNEFKRQGML